MSPLRLFRRLVRLSGLVLLSMTTAARGQDNDAANPLVGVIDFHCHTGPDVVARSINDLELARLARDAGLRGIVLKNHQTMTADRAQLAMQEVPGIEVFGGVVLNRSVGGINAEVVRRMLLMDGHRGRIVWLPTVDAQFQAATAGEERPFVAVVRDGKPVPELAEVFALIAANDLVLATGHSSIPESLVLVAAARNAGVHRIVITHAMAPPLNASMDDMHQLARLGAVIECTWLHHLGDTPESLALEKYAQAIRAIGAEHFLVSSDLGQAGNPLHPDGMRAFIDGLTAAGLTANEIDLIARRNPARLLGLERGD